MSYVSYLELVEGDYGYDLEFQLTDARDQPVDLSGATEVKLVISKPGAEKALIVAPCVVVDASNGLCKYTVASGDFAGQGGETFEVEIEITYPTKVITAKGLVLEIVKELPEVI